MNLPEDIDSQVLEYLLLEFGEDADDADALKISELEYKGAFDVSGVVTHFWWFPCTSEQCWATVEIWKDTYCIGMTTEPPPNDADV
jgi:hypothetical protein